MSQVRCPYCRDFNDPRHAGNGIVICPTCSRNFDGAMAWPHPIQQEGATVPSIDHLALAKDYIAKGDHYHLKAAQELTVLRAEGWTWSALAREVGRSDNWVRNLVAWASNPTDHADSPFGGPAENAARYERQAIAALKDKERRKKAIAALPIAEMEELLHETQAAVMAARVRAKRAEPGDVTLRVADLMGDEQFDPSEPWIDSHLIRVMERANALSHHVKKWGLVVGAITEDQAYRYIQHAERDVADVRAALQERIADRDQAGV
jgi:hypothetical protein